MFALLSSTQAQLKVLSNGNVGIGTSNPQSSFTVEKFKPYNMVRFTSLGDQNGTNGPILLIEAVNPSGINGPTGYKGVYNEGMLYIKQGQPNWYDGTAWRNDSKAMNIADRFIVYNNSKVDITASLWVNGQQVTPSDRRLKTNINTYQNALGKILSMRGVGYEVLDSIEIEKVSDDTSISSKKMIKVKIGRDPYSKKNRIGFVAQELEQILPESVLTNTLTGMKAVDYIAVIPILVEALKEQNKKIETLEAKIAKLENKKAAAKEAEPKALASLTGVNYLYQNTPNPFNKETQISFSLVQSINEASIFVYDLNGTQLKALKINPKTDTRVTIQASELRPGMYIYALVADGNIIDTKRMVIVE